MLKRLSANMADAKAEAAQADMTVVDPSPMLVALIWELLQAARAVPVNQKGCDKLFDMCVALGWPRDADPHDMTRFLEALHADGRITTVPRPGAEERPYPENVSLVWCGPLPEKE